MIRQYISLIVVSVLLCFSQEANGQIELKRANNSILVLKKRELRYIERKGFSADSYDWKDKEVNHYLKNALSNRSSSSVVSALGGVSGALGILMHVASGMADSEEQHKKIVRSANGFLITSAGFFTLSIAISSSGSRKVKKAEQMRLRQKPGFPMDYSSDLDWK